MRFLDRFKKGQNPDWASCMSSQEFEFFQGSIQSYFADYSKKTTYNFDEGYVEAHEGVFEGYVLGLNNLALRCAGQRADEMHGIVREWFSKFWDLSTEQNPISGLTYEEAKIYFRAKVFCEQGGYFGETTLGHSFGDNLKLCLVLDMPTSVMTVPAADIERFAESKDEIIEDAIQRTLEAELSKVELSFLSSGVLKGAKVVSDRSNLYVSLFGFQPQTLFDEPPEDLLFIVPSRSFVLAYPVQTTLSKKVITEMISMCRKVFAQEEGAVSQDLYWQHGLVARRLEIEPDVSETPNWDLFRSVISVR
jgi:hypothetical protein